MPKSPRGWCSGFGTSTTVARGSRQRREVEVGIHVGVREHERPGPEQRQRLHDSTGRLERRLAFLAVFDRDSERAAVAERGESGAPRYDRLITILRTPLAASRATCRSINGTPPISSNGFGFSAVSAPIRSPRPAARSIAFIDRVRMCRAQPRSNARFTCNARCKPLKGCMIYAIVTAFTPATLVPLTRRRSSTRAFGSGLLASRQAFAQDLCAPYRAAGRRSAAEPGPARHRRARPSTRSRSTRGIRLGNDAKAEFSEQVNDSPSATTRSRPSAPTSIERQRRSHRPRDVHQRPT